MATKVKRICTSHPMQLILVADDSDSMSDAYQGIKGKKAKDVSEGIKNWLVQLRGKTRSVKPYFYFSLIVFGTDADIVVENKLINRIRPETIDLRGNSGATNLADALREAQGVLERSQHESYPVPYSDFCSPFVFVYTDGEANQPIEAEKAARELRSLPLPCGSPQIVTLGFGDADHEFLERIASTREHYVDCDSSENLMRLLPQIGTPPVSGAATEAGFAKGINDTSARQRQERIRRNPKFHQG